MFQHKLACPKKPNNYIIFNKVIIIIMYKGFLALKCISYKSLATFVGS